VGAVSVSGRLLYLATKEHQTDSSSLLVYDTVNDQQRTLLQCEPGVSIREIATPVCEEFVIYEAQISDHTAPKKFRAEFRVHDLRTNRTLRTIPCGTDVKPHLLMSPDGRWCVSSDATEFQILNVSDGSVVQLDAKRATRNSMVFLSDSKTLVVAYADRFIRFHDCASGTVVRQIPVIGREVEGLTLSRDGRTLVGCSTDGGLLCWSTESFLQTVSLKLPIDVLKSVYLDVNGDALWLRDKHNQLFRLEAGLDPKHR
jgi:hypothetical protein